MADRGENGKKDERGEAGDPRTLQFFRSRSSVR